MGFFSDMKAMKDISRIKSGGSAKLSISQITCLITNMPDAQKNLSKEEFNAVYALYKEMRGCKTKVQMDMDGYLNTALKIIKRFDAIAPYEKYSGGNESEFAFMMEDLRKTDENSVFLDKEALEYADYLVNSTDGLITPYYAQELVKVIYHYHNYGKRSALNEFDSLAQRIINENVEAKAIFIISNMAGILYPNGVLSKDESENISKKYSDLIVRKMGLNIEK